MFLHPTSRYNFYTDDDIDKHMREWHPEMIPAWDRMQAIERADVFRHVFSRAPTPRHAAPRRPSFGFRLGLYNCPQPLGAVGSAQHPPSIYHPSPNVQLPAPTYGWYLHCYFKRQKLTFWESCEIALDMHTCICMLAIIHTFRYAILYDIGR
jgi:hypothetical protein